MSAEKELERLQQSLCIFRCNGESFITFNGKQLSIAGHNSLSKKTLTEQLGNCIVDLINVDDFEFIGTIDLLREIADFLEEHRPVMQAAQEAYDAECVKERKDMVKLTVGTIKKLGS